MSMDYLEYTRLAAVLQAAYDQAARGKGKERHASAGQAFEDQPMSAINRTLGSIDGFLYQAAKKAHEARRLPSGRAQAELLGAINYLAGAVIALDTWAAGTLPQSDPAQAPVVVPPPPAYDPNSVALPSLCCGNPSLCEQPCFHRAHPNPDADGWIVWSGMNTFFPKGQIVDVRFRDGSTGENHTVSDTEGWQWLHNGSGSDIIKYRIHRAHPVTTGNLVTGEELSKQVQQDGDEWIPWSEKNSIPKCPPPGQTMELRRDAAGRITGYKFVSVDDQFIPWGGGVCPVPHGTHVRVEHRSGAVFEGRALNSFGIKRTNWELGVKNNQTPHPGDIVRYRIIKQPT